MVICQQIFSNFKIGARDFPFNFFLKVLQNCLFFCCGAEVQSWSCNCAHSIVFCNSISADHNVMAASRLLGGAAACVKLLFFAAGHQKSYWSGCVKVAIVFIVSRFSQFWR